MQHRKFLLSVLIAFGVSLPAHAADIAAGKSQAIFACAECHGINGISVVDNFPNLAGQKELYLVTQLKAFRTGQRKFPEMNLLARQLSDADIANLAAYFSSLPATPEGAKK